MGLDVYLKYSQSFDAAKAAEAAAQAESDALWDDDRPYSDYTDDEKDKIREETKLIYAKHGLDEWGSSNDITEIDEPSEIDPEHYFRRGYFRSSYNDGGINSVMQRASCPTLYDIFKPNDEYEFKPDWEKSLTRCNDAIAKYEAFLNSDAGKYRVIHCSDIRVGGAVDEADALRIFMENNTPGRGFTSYSNRDGNFFLEGVNVRAVIRNDATGWKSGGVYIVCDKEIEEDKEDWYLTALRIVRETIEFVLAKPDKENYFLTWSA